MKILLIQPSRSDAIFSKGMVIEPLGLEAIGGCLRDYDVHLLDMRFDDDLLAELRRWTPDVVAITGVSSELYLMQGLFKRVKDFNVEIVTVAGGPHATLVPSDFDNDSVDFVLVGEGEIAFRQLIETLEKGESAVGIPGITGRSAGQIPRQTLRLAVVQDLASLPLPDRTLTAAFRDSYFRGTWRPLASSYSTRGCAFRCDYCCTWRLTGGHFRTRGVGTFLRDLASIDEEYIFLAEDNSLGNPSYMREVYEAVNRAGIRKRYQFYARSDEILANKKLVEDWRSIGLSTILVGLEMASNEELERLNKRNSVTNNEEAMAYLKSIEVESISYFMVDPAFTADDFNRLTDYVLKLKLSHPVFFIMTPLPGTTLFDRVKDELVTRDLTKFDFFHCVTRTSMDEYSFYDRFVRLYEDCYGSRSSTESGKSAFNESIVFNLTRSLRQAYALA